MTMTTYEIIYDINGALKANAITANDCNDAVNKAYSKKYMPNDFPYKKEDLLITITDEANQIIFDSSLEGHLQ